MRVLFISLAFIFIPIIPNAPNTASAEEDKQEWIVNCGYDEIEQEESCTIILISYHIGVLFHLVADKIKYTELLLATRDNSRITAAALRYKDIVLRDDKCGNDSQTNFCLMANGLQAIKIMKAMFSGESKLHVRSHTATQNYAYSFDIILLKSKIPEKYHKFFE